MKTRLFTILASAFILLCACAKESVDINNDPEIKFRVNYPGATKATAAGFSNGDIISIFAVEREGGAKMPLQIGGNYFNNEKLVFNGTSWAGERSLYWSSKPCDFYAYYPAISDITSIDRYLFDIATDQNADGAIEASDFLGAVAENVSHSDAAVSLSFKHLMSKCIVKLNKGASFEGEIQNAVVHVYNTVTTAQVDLSAATLQRYSSGAHKTINMHKINDTTFEAVLVPQNIETRTPLIEIQMGGIAYLLTTNISFRPGCIHTLNVTMNTSPTQEKIEIAIDPSIVEW